MEILITGDFCPINSFSKALDDPRFVDEVRKISKGADLSITNLECPLTDKESPINKTGPALKAPLYLASSIHQLGFNLVTLANNHIMDYECEGLKSTFDELKNNNIPYIGAGRTGKK
jgi:poly-gamma-glutamate capsule biosynthesis protein CapA/YwtB (metallophosphatase superfamily)